MKINGPIKDSKFIISKYSEKYELLNKDGVTVKKICGHRRDDGIYVLNNFDINLILRNIKTQQKYKVIDVKNAVNYSFDISGNKDEQSIICFLLIVQPID